MNNRATLSNADYDQLGSCGISPEEATRQLEILRHSPHRLTLVRPCTLNDGIETISESESAELALLHQQSASAGRWLKFVPASGAASRMFALKNDQDAERLCAQLSDFAFYGLLESSFRQAGMELSELLGSRAYPQIVDRLLDEPGLGYAQRPKGLLLFHHYATGNRTPFEEHLREAARCIRGKDGHCRAHFTVSEEHRSQFEGLLKQLRPLIAAELQTQFEVGFSLQKSSTDTLAIDEDDVPVRDNDGNLLRRPGGHGALLENLYDLQADLIFVKNIDNVGHQRMQGAAKAWIEALGGYLVRLQTQLHAHLQALDSDDSRQAIQLAEEFVTGRFPNTLSRDHANDDVGPRRDHIRRILDRPIRICGMVRNQGEPGGGPFWVRAADGTESVQIVESAEIDPADQAQQEIFQSSTHFNPVFMALGVRDQCGQPFQLRDFVDQDRVILTQKPSAGHTIRVLERPGLWNGSMANWNTVFVEVPIQVFSPVKTVFDLLREEHQPPSLH